MGKGTDKLYVTHSEWSDSTFVAGAGSGASTSNAPSASFRRLPFNFCAISLQPFSHPVCTDSGTIFDLTNILPWLKKHGTNPVDGTPLKSADLTKLNFAKNDDGEYVDPVTFKPLTDNTHIVALKTTGNVFAWETIERLNIKAKNWRDLVSDTEFSRKDIITIQDPTNLASRDLSSFKYLKDGVSTLTEEQKRERADPTNNLNLDAMGSSAKVIRAKEAVAKARLERENMAKAKQQGDHAGRQSIAKSDSSAVNGRPKSAMPAPKNMPYNAAQHTTGKAAASFTSTGLTPHTSSERALLSEEEYMLKPKRVKQKGYARIQTNLGDINVELQTEYAPRAVWNFVQLSKKGYYRNIAFHRNIRNFMLQGGDPTGTGRGGQSIWGKLFTDEYGQSPLTHNARGILSMANKGKNTNTSQFFITYRATPHLDRKHTIFGKVIDNDPGGESQKTLSKLENVKTEDDKPVEECVMEDVVVFVDPFEEFQKSKAAQDVAAEEQAETLRQGGTEDDKTTWTGKKVNGKESAADLGSNGGVGKYLDVSSKRGGAPDSAVNGVVEEWDMPTEEPPPKRRRAGGFGNFDGW